MGILLNVIPSFFRFQLTLVEAIYMPVRCQVRFMAANATSHNATAPNTACLQVNAIEDK